MQFILNLKKKRKKSKIRVATLTYIVGRLRLKDTRVTSSSFDLKFDNSRAIYQRYVDEKKRWYQAQFLETEKTNQVYRMVMELLALYFNTSFR
jgi:hypothetical protein